jgi:hypothetical protein
MRRHALFALAALVASSMPAFADGMDKRSPAMQNFYGPTYSHTIFTGGEVARNSWEGYLGTIVALNRDLSKDGVLLRAMGTYGQYDYLAAAGLGTRVDGTSRQADLMIGYQWVRQQHSLALYAGVDFIDQDLSPDDPFNPARGRETGFKVGIDLESHRYSGLPYYYAVEGTYSTAFDTYFLMGRLGANRNGTVFGVEGWLLGDESGDAQRLGGFVGFGRELRSDLFAEMTFSAGYQFTDDEFAALCGSFFGGDGAYAMMNVSFFFGGERHRPLKP